MAYQITVTGVQWGTDPVIHYHQILIDKDTDEELVNKLVACVEFSNTKNVIVIRPGDFVYGTVSDQYGIFFTAAIDLNVLMTAFCMGIFEGKSIGGDRLLELLGE